VLAAALLQLLSACLPDSPGSQLALHQLGATSRLLQLMRTPDNSPRTGLSTIHALALLANTGLPAAQAAATAGGLVAVVMNVLQQQAMAGVLVSEVCMTALPSLLDGNPAGKQQALHYGMLPLLVHLLRSSPSPTTLAAAAHSLAVLAVHNSELQGQVTAAGGLSALMDRLDPEAAQRDSSTAAQAQAALAAAAAAAAAAAEAVAMAAQASADGEDGNTGSAADTRGAAQPPVQDAAAAGPQHVAATAIASASGSEQAPGTVQDTVAASAQRLAFIRVQAACLHAVAVLAHDNSFTKNTARQQGIMALLRQLLASGAAVLQAAVMAETSALTGTHLRPEHQQQQWQRPVSPASSNDLAERPGSGAWPHASLRVRTPRAHAGGAAAAQAHRQEQQQEQRAQLHVLAAAVHVLAELCHGNHSNQQAAGAEGLIDQLVGLAAGALGSKLATAARHSSLLASACDALAAAVEFCNTSKLAAREAGAVDVCSRLLLMVTEVPDVSGVLMETRLQGAVTAACGAVAALAQDCEDNQAAFARCPGFVPALFRLLGVGEPTVAYQAARCVCVCVVRACAGTPRTAAHAAASCHVCSHELACPPPTHPHQPSAGRWSSLLCARTLLTTPRTGPSLRRRRRTRWWACCRAAPSARRAVGGWQQREPPCVALPPRTLPQQRWCGRRPPCWRSWWTPPSQRQRHQHHSRPGLHQAAGQAALPHPAPAAQQQAGSAPPPHTQCRQQLQRRQLHSNSSSSSSRGAPRRWRAHKAAGRPLTALRCPPCLLS
jgi:hypothetical protein